jgi:pimeloyl-ACP methyl ester carboxylesterase
LPFPNTPGARISYRRIGTGRYVEVPDGGHGVTIENAEEINQVLSEHFARRSGSDRPLR